MDTTLDYKNSEFYGNTMGTCVGQVLYWFMGLAGQISSGTGAKEPPLTPYDKATTVQFSLLDNGRTAELTKIADSKVVLRGTSSAEALKRLTPWTGVYKLYIIASDKGHGHALGAYFPWRGRNQFYDPNLVAGECTEDKWLWELLSMWPGMYVGVGEVDASWGFENLFVFSDPKNLSKKPRTSRYSAVHLRALGEPSALRFR